jgi:hypothetical protein
MMKILAIEHENPGCTASDFAPLLEEEARRVWELHQAGVIRELYFRQEQNEAVLVLECASTAEAEVTLARLPLAAAGLIQFELIGLRAYPGFERLFSRSLTPPIKKS